MEIKRLRADSVMIPSARLGAAVWTEAVSLAKQFFADSSSASTKELDKFLLRFRPEVCSVIGDDRTFFEDDETSAREDPSKIPLTCIDESRALLFDDKRLREIMERDVLERVDFGGKPALVRCGNLSVAVHSRRGVEPILKFVLLMVMCFVFPLCIVE